MTTERKRILIVDDEVTFTRMVRLNLEKTGRYEVREENRGRRAAAAAREFHPDLIVLDVIMPDMDGGEVASTLQNDPKLKDIPVVFLTANVSKREVGESGKKLGGLYFLAKPITLEQLVEYIEKHVKKPEAPPSFPKPSILVGAKLHPSMTTPTASTAPAVASAAGPAPAPPAAPTSAPDAAAKSTQTSTPS
jgi:CheY-like chemotaxis protein